MPTKTGGTPERIATAGSEQVDHAAGVRDGVRHLHSSGGSRRLHQERVLQLQLQRLPPAVRADIRITRPALIDDFTCGGSVTAQETGKLAFADFALFEGVDGEELVPLGVGVTRLAVGSQLQQLMGPPDGEPRLLEDGAAATRD